MKISRIVSVLGALTLVAACEFTAKVGDPDASVPGNLSNECADGIKNGSETDVDCGGPSCSRCTAGKTCLAGADCLSGDCSSGVCGPQCPSNCAHPPGPCYQTNGYIADPATCECGYTPLATGTSCDDGNPATANDVCDGHGQCAGLAETCTDGIKNGTETDVDCGGAACPRCSYGQACADDGDCITNSCVITNSSTGRACEWCVLIPESCENGIQDGNEADVDCGGFCLACEGGKACTSPTQCASNRCVDGVCAARVSCDNGIQDGTETDVDCGGPACPRCALGRTCTAAADCVTMSCDFGTCQPCVGVQYCDNGIQDGNETDVDCGGTCFPCAADKACASRLDCVSNDCIGGVCHERYSCVNGWKDGDETDVDCGGPACATCAAGKACKTATDCASRSCLDMVCR